MKNGLRNLCYAVWTVLGLVLIANYLGRPAGASGFAQVLGNVVGESGAHVLTSTGESYYAGGGLGSRHWVLSPYSGGVPLPIPISQIAIVGGNTADLIIDTAGNGWALTQNQWESLGPVPGGPTAVTPQTWSQIKGQYAPKTGGGQ